jgi:hypothetical protein
MVTRAVRERLAQDIGGWLTDGLISPEAHALLEERYQARTFGVGQAVKYLGISGGLLAFFGLLGLAAASFQSMATAAVILLLVGAGLTWWGVLLSLDPLARRGASSSTVLALGVASATLGVGLAANQLGVRDETLVVITGTAVLPVVGLLAYRFRNLFLLVLALLGFFHWVGSWTAMVGRSTYELSIQDPRLMCGAALLVVSVGVWHELRLRPRTGRFFQVYQALGLAYLNLSLLILTIDSPHGWGSQPLWIAALALVAVCQIVAGARLHSGLFTGFGVTALALNIYTRYFESFWDRLHPGAFFLLGGLALFAAGVACELLMKRVRAVSP